MLAPSGPDTDLEEVAIGRATTDLPFPMKKIFVIIALTGASFAQAATVNVISDRTYADKSQVWLTGGKTQDGATVSFGGQKNGLGGEFSFIMDSEYSKSDILDYSIPHSSYKSLGNKRVGNTLGLDLLAFAPLGQGFSAGVGAGAYFTEYRRVAQSQVTGWLYTQDKEVKLRGALSLRVHYAHNGLLLGAGIHSVRGVFISAGKDF